MVREPENIKACDGKSKLKITLSDMSPPQEERGSKGMWGWKLVGEGKHLTQKKVEGVASSQRENQEINSAIQKNHPLNLLDKKRMNQQEGENRRQHRGAGM